MKTILLYGFLGKQFGKVHRYNVKDAREAVRALTTTLKGFKEALIDGGSYRVSIGGETNLTVKELSDPHSNKESIRIIPVISGAGKGAGQIILGVVLIAAAFVAPMVGLGAASPYLYSVGASMILGGVAQLLFVAPDASASTREDVTNAPSFSFDGAVNTMAQGNPVPVCYGRLIVGSQVISAGLSSAQT